MAQKGMLLIVSGPSGVGKGTLVAKLMESDPSFCFSCSATTRTPREGEIDGVHYHFLTDEAFDMLVSENAFLEHASVHGNRYGTLKAPVEKMMVQGKNVVLDIDQQGAIQVMENTSEYVSVFILPPSYSELRRRLTARNTDTPEAIERRLGNARGEVEKLGHYQYAIINNSLDAAFEELKAIVTAEKQRIGRFVPEIGE